MAGPHHAEVAMIESREFGFVQAFGDRQNSSVDESDVGIGILPHELVGSNVVWQLQVCYGIRPEANVFPEREDRIGV